MGLWKMLCAGHARRKAMEERIRELDREMEALLAEPEWRQNVAAFRPSTLPPQVSRNESIPFNLSTAPGELGSGGK